MLIKDQKFVNSLGNQIRNLRVKKNISQEELANIADIPINQVGRIERGEVNTTVVTIKAIAEALEIPLRELFNF